MNQPSQSYVLVSVVTVCMALAGCARHSDRAWVMREFSVPQEVELTVQSTPEDDSDWAHRKNLFLIATFKFTPTQFLEYNKRIETQIAAGKSKDWLTLPFSAEMKKSLITRFEAVQMTAAVNKAAHGYYFLKSSEGNNLLTSSKRKEWQTSSSDCELAILNADSAELKVFVKQ